MDIEKIAIEDSFNRKMEQLRKAREGQSGKWMRNENEITKSRLSAEKSIQKYYTSLIALEAKFGLGSEATFRNALKGILKNFDVEVLDVTEYDDDGVVFDYPEQIELDIIIVNGKLIIAELKSSMSKPDMYTFYRKAKFYENRHDRKANHLIVISPMVDKKAEEVAEKLGIKIYSHAEDIEEDIAT